MNYDLSALDEVYTRAEIARLIQAYRTEHHCMIGEAIEALTEQIRGGRQVITDAQIRTALTVLRAYAQGELMIDVDLRQELEGAIEIAYAGAISVDINTDQPPPRGRTA